MRVNLQPAYVLHSRPYRDSSLLLEVFTAEHGRISLVARGARRQRRGGSQGALLQLFRPLLVSFAGRGEMKNLVTVETAGNTARLRGERLFSGLYVNELLVRLLHRHDPHPRLFASYTNTLSSLGGTQVLDGVLRRFELELLGELGYGFSLQVEGDSGAPLLADMSYRFNPECGLVRVAAAEPPGSGSFLGAHLLALGRGEFDGAARSAAKSLLRQALASHLGPEPLRSRQLFGARHGAAGGA